MSQSLHDVEVFDYEHSNHRRRRVAIPSGTMVNTLSTGYSSIVSEKFQRGQFDFEVHDEALRAPFESMKIAIDPEAPRSTEYKTNPQIYKLSSIDTEQARIVLKKPIELILEIHDDFVTCRNELLNISSMDENIETAIIDFCEIFIFDYKNYLTASQDVLSPGSKNLLKRYKSMIKSEEWHR